MGLGFNSWPQNLEDFMQGWDSPNIKLCYLSLFNLKYSWKRKIWFKSLANLRPEYWNSLTNLSRKCLLSIYKSISKKYERNLNLSNLSISCHVGKFFKLPNYWDLVVTSNENHRINILFNIIEIFKSINKILTRLNHEFDMNIDFSKIAILSKKVEFLSQSDCCCC